MNKKQSSPQMGTLASDVLRDPKFSKIQKALAGSVMAQTSTPKQTGADMETVAAKALKSPKYSPITKSLAGSTLAQANKKR